MSRAHRILALLFSGVMMTACQTRSNFPTTPLFEGLEASGSYEAGQALLQRRLSEQFPLGGDEAGLAEFLESQEFTVERKTGGDAPTPIFGFAEIKRVPHDPRSVTVLWRAAADGKLTEMNVGYSSFGML